MAKTLANSIEGKAEDFLRRIENLHADLEAARGLYMKECKPLRADIKEVYDEAEAADIPVKALRGLVKYRALARKQDAIGDGLDTDDRSSYEELLEALGDFATTELGAAAVGKAA